MTDASADRADLVRSVIIWAVALVAGIAVALVVGGLFGFGSAPGLIFGAIVFMVLPYLVPAGAKVGLHGVAPVAAHPVVHAPPAPAPVVAEPVPAEPVPAAEPAAPVAERVVDEEIVPEPEAGPVRFVEMPVSEPPAANAISERVREAARAAGEAARAMAGGDAAVDATGRPAALAGPRDGVGDDLKRLKGVGPKFEVVLHDLGIWHFDQIAAWGPGEVAWIDANLDGFTGRVLREDWIGQARILAAGGETEHSQRVDRGEST